MRCGYKKMIMVSNSAQVGCGGLGSKYTRKLYLIKCFLLFEKQSTLDVFKFSTFELFWSEISPERDEKKHKTFLTCGFKAAWLYSAWPFALFLIMYDSDSRVR